MTAKIIVQKGDRLTGVQYTNIHTEQRYCLYCIFVQIWVLGDNSTKLADHLAESRGLYTLTKTKKLLVLWFGCGRQQKRHAATPPPAGVRRRMERNRQKLVGWDKGSLTERQTKGTGTTTIQIRRKHNTNHITQRAALLDSRCMLRSRE